MHVTCMVAPIAVITAEPAIQYSFCFGVSISFTSTVITAIEPDSYELLMSF